MYKDDLSVGGFLAPEDLSVTPAQLRRILVIGQCTSYGYIKYAGGAFVPRAGFAGPGTYEHMMTNNFDVLPNAEQDISNYEFQIISPPLRTILPEKLPFHAYAGRGGSQADLVAEATERLHLFIDNTMRLNREHGLLTFFANFVVPQQNLTGRFGAGSGGIDLQALVGSLNQVIRDKMSEMKNAYVLDREIIAQSIGKMYCSDEVLCASNHNSFLGEFDHPIDQGRIEPTRPLYEYYETKEEEFYLGQLRCIGSMFRTIRQIDQVKLVVVDLDDTIWRGVSAEEGLSHHIPIEGWPLGLVEALLVLKSRGVLLAIISKNSESLIRTIWERTFGDLITLDDFTVCKINWLTKAENMAEVLASANLLAKNVVFIDDNPVERAAMKAAYPDIRVLGSTLYHIRRVLLWSPETQVSSITAESASRTQMVQKQIERDTTAKRMSREDFLATLNLRIVLTEITSDAHPAFARAVELINKTNQFNTTGERRPVESFAALLRGGGQIFTFEVEDKFTRYGVVGVVIIKGSFIEQFVMSCRVLGLDVETAILSELARRMPAGDVTARLVETPSNMPCRTMYARAGFVGEGETWRLSSQTPIPFPVHARILEMAA